MFEPDVCHAPLHPLAQKGIEEFNAGRYFEAHEELEHAWMEETGHVRDLYRGILQVAVMYYHIQRQNYAGARKMFARSRRWLAPFPEVCRGVCVAELVADSQRVDEEVTRLGPGQISRLDPNLLRPVRLNEP